MTVPYRLCPVDRAILGKMYAEIISRGTCYVKNSKYLDAHRAMSPDSRFVIECEAHSSVSKPKIKLPWHTCSLMIGMYSHMFDVELEKPPSQQLENLKKINEGTQQ
ncbi:MAG: hypothetical protein ACW987_20065 [Candidatus Thorarchaeota archaeon]